MAVGAMTSLDTEAGGDPDTVDGGDGNGDACFVDSADTYPR
jgi:hypothetical protein